MRYSIQINFLLVLGMLFFFNIAPIQAKSVDSLLVELNVHRSNDSIRLQLYKQIFNKYLNLGKKEMFVYGDSVLFLARQLGVKQDVIDGYSKLGIGYWYLGDTEKGIASMEQGLAIAKSIKDSIYIGKLENNIGFVYAQTGQYFKAYQTHKKILENIDLNRPSYLQCTALLNMGRDLHLNKSYEEALVPLRQLDTLIQRQLIVDLKEEDYSKKSYTVSVMLLETYLKLNDTLNINAIVDRGLIHFSGEKNLLGAQQTYILGRLELWKGNIAKALDFHHKSLEISEHIGYGRGIISVCAELSRVYTEKQGWHKVIEYGEKGLDLIKSNKDLVQQVALLDALQNAYAKIGQFETAITMGLDYRMLKDSLDNMSNANLLDQLNYQEQILRNEDDKLLLLAEKNYNEAAIEYVNYGLLAIGLLLVFVVLLGGYFLQEKNLYERKNIQLRGTIKKHTAKLEKVNKVLISTNEEILSFSEIISNHLQKKLEVVDEDIRNVQKSEVAFNQGSVRDYLGFINNNIAQMRNLMQDILTFTNVVKVKVDFKPCNTQQIVNAVKYELREEIKSKNAVVETENLSIIVSSQDLLHILLKNLISNSIKFNKSDAPKVEVALRHQDGVNFFLVKDNGIGIQKEYQEKIFEAFSRLHNRQEYKGSGLGLAVVKKIIHILNGSIEVNSDLGKGTTIKIGIPMVSTQEEDLTVEKLIENNTL